MDQQIKRTLYVLRYDFRKGLLSVGHSPYKVTKNGMLAAPGKSSGISHKRVGNFTFYRGNLIAEMYSLQETHLIDRAEFLRCVIRTYHRLHKENRILFVQPTPLSY